MKRFPFKKIDAFATTTSTGNPAGAVYLEGPEGISEDDMQRIARELKGFVSEVGYVWSNDEGECFLRYFSSEREVEFCGHATIAIMHDLIRNDSRLMSRKVINIKTNKGWLQAINRIGQEGAVFISAPEPVCQEKAVDVISLTEALGIRPGDLDEAYPLSVVNAGLETLVVPIRTLESVLALAPRMEELKAFCEASSIDIMIVFSDKPADKKNGYRTRVFAPTFGYLEDPATGSGNAALGYYLMRNEKWDGGPMRLEQNGYLESPNIVNLATKKHEDGTLRVIFGGSAVVRIEGEYLLS